VTSVRIFPSGRGESHWGGDIRRCGSTAAVWRQGLPKQKSGAPLLSLLCDVLCSALLKKKQARDLRTNPNAVPNHHASLPEAETSEGLRGKMMSGGEPLPRQQRAGSTVAVSGLRRDDRHNETGRNAMIDDGTRGACLTAGAHTAG